MNGLRVMTNDEARFWSRVSMGATCWTWSGSRTTGGYGNLRWRGGYAYAHRLAWELKNGPIPDGMVIDHLCRNRACCRPEHLQPVEHVTNVRRGLSGYGLRSECKRGHDVADPANVRIDAAGYRQCRKCDAIRTEAKNLRRKEWTK